MSVNHNRGREPVRVAVVGLGYWGPNLVRNLHELGEGGTLSFPAFDAGGHVVWGMTHRILTDFLELYAASAAAPPPR